MVTTKINQMNQYENISYNSVVMKNAFYADDSDSIKELLISNYTYMPSVELNFLNSGADLENHKSNDSAVWTEVINFDEEDISQSYIDIEKLKKYLKFYVKF